MGRGRPKKSKYEELPEEFRTAIEGSNCPEIRERVAQIALDQAQLMAAKELDEDLVSKKELAKEAGMIYSEGTKANRLKIKYCKEMLEAKGDSRTVPNLVNNFIKTMGAKSVSASVDENGIPTITITK